MADNYLEKKMEEHRRGTAVKPPRRRLSPIGERPGMVSFKIEQLRVFVTVASTEYGAAIVRRLSEAGCKVAFTSEDDKTGRELAQTSGARHYPSTFKGSVVDDMEKVWGGIDALIVANSEYISDVKLYRIILIDVLPENIDKKDTNLNAIITKELTPSEVAHLCLLLCLKESTCLKGVVLGAF